MVDDPTIEPEPTPEPEPEPVVAPTPEPTPEPQPDPLKLSPELQSRYKSADDLATFAATKQGEADRLRSELDNYKREHPAPEPQPMPNEEQLERLGRDPLAFVREATSDIRAQVALSEFSRLHPDVEQYKAGMSEILNRTPDILRDPRGLEMAYLLAKSQTEATKATEAAGIKATQTAQTIVDKQTKVFVEGATPKQPPTSSGINTDDSVAEMDKKLDAANVGWISDDERERYD